jgi:branched-subunit amino acid transport protein AzlD
MTAAWIAVAALAVGTFAAKALGPVVLGAREPGERAMRVTALVAPAILAALVVYETLGTRGSGLVVDARVAGLGAAAVAIALRAPMIVVVLAAAAVAALVRAFT